jgi:hypothetical protein
MSPGEAQAALGRLDVIHQEGAVTEEQYRALKAALESMLASA